MSVCIVVRSQDDHCQNKEEWANRTSSITHIPGYKDAILCGLCNVNVSILVFFGGGAPDSSSSLAAPFTGATR